MRRRVALTLSVVLFAAAGCASGSPEPGPSGTDPPGTATPTQSPTAEPEVQRVDVDVDASGAITMPDTLLAGVVEFTVSAADLAELTVLEPAPGYTAADLAADFGPHASEAAQAAGGTRLASQTRSLGGTWAEAGSPATFVAALPAGAFWFVDLGREPGEAGDDDVIDPANVLLVTVTEAEGTATLPASDGVATAGDDRSWMLPDTLPASGGLLIRNETDGTHQLVLEPVPAGQTAQEWLAGARTGHRDCTCGSPARVGPGSEFLWHYDLPPGLYGVLDHSIGDAGYPQYNGAGASVVQLG